MNTKDRLQILLIAPSLDGDDVGEGYSVFKWVEALCAVADVTLLASSRRGVPLALQLPQAEVVTWPEHPLLYLRFERFNAQAKPWLSVFGRHVAAWLRARLSEGRTWDIAHQVLPQAMRHPSALRHFDIPYVIGPLGGGLKTPQALKGETPFGPLAWLRGLDDLRLRYDRPLRQTYSKAAYLLGVAPYIGHRLESVGLGAVAFQPVLERGHGILPHLPERPAITGQAQLLHVGRTIRTKGLRDVIRAMALLPDLPGVTLTSVGDGPDLAACKAEATSLGLSERIIFRGKIPRAEVDAEYRAADIFCFPSFREPMGGVFFEAMEYGLPVITVGYGGPNFIVDDTSGIRLPVEGPTIKNPHDFALAIAKAIRDLAENTTQRLELGVGARARIKSFGSWSDKADQTIKLYHAVLGDNTSH